MCYFPELREYKNQLTCRQLLFCAACIYNAKPLLIKNFDHKIKWPISLEHYSQN